MYFDVLWLAPVHQDPALEKKFGPPSGAEIKGSTYAGQICSPSKLTAGGRPLGYHRLEDSPDAGS